MNKWLVVSLLLVSLLVAGCGTTEPTPLPPTAPPPEPTAAAPAPTEAAPEPTAAAPEPEPEPEAEVSKTLRLPDLDGRKVVAVSGNDYTPLNFVDPLTGEAVGWEYDAVNEICRRLNCQVDWQVTTWDTMIAAVHDGQFDVGLVPWR